MIFIVFQQINLNYLLVHSIQNGNELMRKLIDIIIYFLKSYFHFKIEEQI